MNAGPSRSFSGRAILSEGPTLFLDYMVDLHDPDASIPADIRHARSIEVSCGHFVRDDSSVQPQGQCNDDGIGEVSTRGSSPSQVRIAVGNVVNQLLDILAGWSAEEVLTLMAPPVQIVVLCLEFQKDRVRNGRVTILRKGFEVVPEGRN